MSLADFDLSHVAVVLHIHRGIELADQLAVQGKGHDQRSRNAHQDNEGLQHVVGVSDIGGVHIEDDGALRTGQGGHDGVAVVDVGKDDEVPFV